MRRAIQNLVEDPLAEMLLQGKIKSGDTVLIDRAGDELTMTPITEAQAVAETA
jgi:ATP-dependent Clp protease ATP-binding subunit ClpC